MSIKHKWMHSIKTKQLVMFFFMILFIIICSFFLFRSAMQVAVNGIYQKMESQAEYYLNSVEYQLSGIISQQANFFYDRKLVFLMDREMMENGYDRRETLLSLQERLFSLKSSSKLVKEAVLYVPGAGYVISPSVVSDYNEESEVKLEELKPQIWKLVPEGSDLTYALVESPFSEGNDPRFCLQIVIDGRQLTENLNSFADKSGGAFWYNEQSGWYLEDTLGDAEGEAVLQMLQQSEQQVREGISEITIDHTVYLVSTISSQYLGMLVQYASKEEIMSEMSIYYRWFIIFVVFAICLAFVFSHYTERMVNRPLKKLQQAFDVLKQGKMDIQISHSAHDEFSYIYDGFNHTTSELHRLIDEVYVQKNMAQKAELKQLQAQINPHFLYNSFFLLSRRVQRGDLENARILADFLGKYFKFLTRNGSDVVTLQNEIEHAECYAGIQATRFASRITVEMESLPEQLWNIQVPRLIIQPILENAFEHGLEDQEEGGILKVSFEMGNESERKRKCRILIENNGYLEEGQLSAMKEKLADDYQGEVTGMVNIHKRLKSFYHGEGWLEINKRQQGGICVCAVLPLESGNYETEGFASAAGKISGQKI